MRRRRVECKIVNNEDQQIGGHSMVCLQRAVYSRAALGLASL